MFKKQKKEAPEPITQEAKIEANIKRKSRLIKQLKHDAITKVVGFIAAFIIVFTFIFGVTLAPTNDMYPALHEGDLLIYYRLGRVINTDVVLYKAPDSSLQIGRVEGTEGETLGKTDGGLLTINGNIQPIQERSGLYFETKVGSQDLKGEIGHNEYLVLGDQRETATDSREYGLIPRKSIKGKVFTIIRRRPL